MLILPERGPSIPDARGWAISVLQQVGASRECEEHGWCERAIEIAINIRRSTLRRAKPLVKLPRCWTRASPLAGRGCRFARLVISTQLMATDETGE